VEIVKMAVLARDGKEPKQKLFRVIVTSLREGKTQSFWVENLRYYAQCSYETAEDCVFRVYDGKPDCILETKSAVLAYSIQETLIGVGYGVFVEVTMQ
jgi:hypothetical protein